MSLKLKRASLVSQVPFEIAHDWASRSQLRSLWSILFAGTFSREAGQFYCVNCDNVGDAYQELPGQTSCKACPANSVRYIGVLTSANQSACQCKEGVAEHLSACMTIVSSNVLCIAFRLFPPRWLEWLGLLSMSRRS
jgi:hypothetical protein